MTDHLITFSAASFTVDTEARTLTGTLLPFGETSAPAMDGQRYHFAPGEVEIQGEDVPTVLNYGHDAHTLNMQVGAASELGIGEAGVTARFSVAKTPEGDRILTLASHKPAILRAFSAEVEGEFAADKDGVMRVKAGTKALITGGAVVRRGAFAGATITNVAASAAPNRKEPVMGDENTKPGEAPAFSKAEGDALMAQVTGLAGKLAELENIKVPVGPGEQLQVNEEPIYRFAGTEPAPSGFDFATDLLAAGTRGDAAALERIKKFSAERLEARFVSSGDVNETNQPTYRPDMFVGQAPTPQSPLFDTFRKGNLANVTPFFWVKLDRGNTDAGVADHTEGTDPTDTDLVTAAGTTVTPTAVSGKVHITREVGDQGGNPQVSGLIWSEFERSYSIALETKTGALLTASAGSVTSLTSAIAAGAAGDVAGKAIEAGLIGVQFLADGSRFSKMFGHVDLYTALAAFENTEGEKRYPIINPQNRSGIAGAKYSFLDIAGYRMEPAASLGATSAASSNSWLADPNAVHVWNSGLQRLDKLSESVEGWDLGCFGYFAGVVYDLTGLRKIPYDPAA